MPRTKSRQTLGTVASLFVPGLFQTPAFTQAIFNSPKPGFENIEEALKFRMARQRILTRENPPAVHAVIHEAALHMRFGSPQMMREQMLRLIELARLPHVTVQIYPFSAQAHAALSGNFVHIIPSVAQLSTVVLEQPTGSRYLSERTQLRQHGGMFERLAEYALAPVDVSSAPEAHSVKDSLALIQHLLYTLQGEATMSELDWQKSTFSGGPQGECVNVAAADGTIRLRESEDPRTVLTTTPDRLAALLRHLTSRPSS
ncbi:Scr1 family TA system antitoxin-like transcriptional regulator [Streptomyces sp. SD15]